MKGLLILLFIIFPFGQLARLPIGIPGVSLLLIDIVTALFVFRVIFFGPKKVFRAAAGLWGRPLVLFVIIAVFSLLVNALRLSTRELAVSALYLLRLVVYASFCFSLKSAVQQQKITAGFLKKGLLTAGFASAVFGLAQWYFYPSLRNLYYLGWDEHLNRAFGTFFDPGFLAVILALALLAVTDATIEKIKDQRSKIKNTDQKLKIFLPGIAVWVVLFLTLVLTHARSGYLAFIAGFAGLAVFRGFKRIGVMGVMGVIAVMIAFSQSQEEGVRLDRTASSLQRVESWSYALRIFADSPIFGVGYNAYRFAQRDYKYLKNDWQGNHAGAASDSSFLTVAATMGTAGAAAFLYFWGSVLYYGIRKKQVLLSASVLALLINSLFINSLFYPWVMFWYFSLLAVGL